MRPRKSFCRKISISARALRIPAHALSGDMLIIVIWHLKIQAFSIYAKICFADIVLI